MLCLELILEHQPEYLVQTSLFLHTLIFVLMLACTLQKSGGRVLWSGGEACHQADRDSVHNTGPGASRAGRADQREVGGAQNFLQLLPSLPSAWACAGHHAPCRHQLRHRAAAGRNSWPWNRERWPVDPGAACQGRLRYQHGWLTPGSSQLQSFITCKYIIMFFSSPLHNDSMSRYSYWHRLANFSIWRISEVIWCHSPKMNITF